MGELHLDIYVERIRREYKVLDLLFFQKLMYLLQISLVLPRSYPMFAYFQILWFDSSFQG